VARAGEVTQTRRTLPRSSTIAAVLIFASVPAAARAAYSPPLTRVRIDRDVETHTPSVLYAADKRAGDLLITDLRAYGAQYILQKEWAKGLGLQIGVAAAYVDLDVAVGGRSGPQLTAEGTGYLIGGQLRAYAMLWSGEVVSIARPSALTAFVNLRGVFYSAKGEADLSDRLMPPFSARFDSISGGVGMMAELAIADWLSICPYAWFSPGFRAQTRYAVAEQDAVIERGQLSLRQPIRVGLDVWIYYLGAASDSHIALSAIASLFDTEDRGNREVSIVIGYTF
jgi:hypothetical protein